MFSISALKHMVKVAKSQNIFSFLVNLQNIIPQNHYPIRLKSWRDIDFVNFFENETKIESPSEI